MSTRGVQTLAEAMSVFPESGEPGPEPMLETARKKKPSANRCPPPSDSRIAAHCAAPLQLVECVLAEADRLRSDLRALVLAEELQGLLKTQLAVRDQADQLLRRRAPHVRELLLLG